jgi:alkaline phosphatase D
MAQLERQPASGAPLLERRLGWLSGGAGPRCWGRSAERKPANPLVIGGDVHFNCVADLKPDFDDPKSPVVATEFCGTSITSQTQPQARLDALRAGNPHIRLIDGERRGYVTLELAERHCLARLRVIDNEKKADASIATLAAFVVEDGRAGAEEA